MAAPKNYDVSLVSVKGIGIQSPIVVFSLENAIYRAEEFLKCEGSISYDKVWRSVKKKGAYVQVVELPAGPLSIHQSTAVLIIAQQDFTPAPKEYLYPYAQSLDMYEEREQIATTVEKKGPLRGPRGRFVKKGQQQ